MLGHAHALAPGSVLRQYETIDVLGMGGFGITYRARDQDLNAFVAIKEYLPSDLAYRQGDSTVTARSKSFERDFEWGLNRFIEEGRALAKFTHHHIVRVRQYFKQNGTGYLVMDYEKGESLEDLLKRSTSLSEMETKDILFPILDGLKNIHEQEYLHRDIKPANIIIREAKLVRGNRPVRNPVLIDFGAARQAIGPKTRAITAVLTPGYAPLEQYSPDDNQGPWTDIYALGGVAYRCLTGEKPPDATVRVRKDPLTPVLVATKGQVSRQFAEAIEWALRVEETARPQSIDEFAAAISSGADEQTRIAPDETKSSTKKDRPKKARRQKEKTAATPTADSTIIASPLEIPIAPASEDSTTLGPVPSVATATPESISEVDATVSPVAEGSTIAWKGEPKAAHPVAKIQGGRSPGRRKTLYLLGAASALVVIVAVVGMRGSGPPVDPVDQRAWDQAISANTIAAFEGYLESHAQGSYAQTAEERIASIREEIEQAWNGAITTDTMAVYGEFLEKYRGSNLHIAEAEEARERVRPEEDGWTRALEQRTASAYQQYLYSFPTGKHQADAESELSNFWSAFDTAEDEAGKTAVAAASVGSCRDYLRAYPDGRYVEACQERIGSLVQPAAPPPSVLPPFSVEYQRKLIAIGAYTGALASILTSELTAAITSFQSKRGLTENGIFDNPTTAAIDKALEDLDTAYEQAKSKRTRRDYEAFVRSYPNSTYSQDVQNRISQCRVQTRTDPPAVSVVPHEETVESPANPCEAATAKVQSEARRACVAKGGQPTSVSVTKSEEVPRGGLFNRIFQFPACVARAEAQCETPGSQRQVDVCP